MEPTHIYTNGIGALALNLTQYVERQVMAWVTEHIEHFTMDDYAPLDAPDRIPAGSCKAGEWNTWTDSIRRDYL
jgi:hypothetical protein